MAGEADYVVVGSGINGLVAASLLARRGRKVILLERNDRLGGCIRTEAITEPGFVHDVMATTFVLFTTSPAYALLKDDLAARGLSFADSFYPTGVLLPDGRHAILSRERSENRSRLEALAAGDGAAFGADMDAFAGNAGFVFALLGGALWTRATLKTVGREILRRGPRGLAAFFGESMVNARAHLETTYASEEARALFAPWVLHAGLGPEAAFSGEMVRVIGFALEAAGAPVVKGGAEAILTAFRRLIEDHGGEIRTNADVEAVTRDTKGAANGVRLAGGEAIRARVGVICSLAPDQLYRRLLPEAELPADLARSLKRYRHGKGNMQVHYALSRPPRWPSEELGQVALLHLTPGLDGVSRAVNEAERGLLPAEPTICVGQPAMLDPSRAPDGASILWLQLPETPRRVKGDAAGTIPVPADGRWTPALREAYADRIEAILASHIEDFRDSVLKRVSYAPADLEAMNVNLVGGDPYGGSCGIDQFFLWRPFKTSVNHRTHVPKLYHIGASTHPGPGLGAGSGFALAQTLR
ncbi:phytoene desaturase family protein [Antarcticirhabdus aurantiaca]|uniref:NAD(P)/FAD-dependent oxidoreductase n=1 Tax=Antarcticirhabdus aurantiaca TaxID=2606717 RepID=A0ACD4NMN2_9HYPH|nr:NAD(P)/FAD-dependent oxidoreductase [Antarcticirhabdus aurantiaca]WAJ28140.1 NAD(P)/FAD-dependent oxidoreductase [Jeongeuplla avenae]